MTPANNAIAHSGRRRDHALAVGCCAMLSLLGPLGLRTPEVASPLPAASSAVADVPGWAKQAVWYQIFTERFCNGDTLNDPTVKDIAGSWPHEVPPEWHISKWTGDWYHLQSWEQIGNRGFYFRAQQRRYGGDLEGVIGKLDYLENLGINAIYFTPLFQSPSLHKYDATMYHHIDRNFGPDPAGDLRIEQREEPANPATWQWTSADRLFLSLVKEAHRRGIRVILDGVFNHVGVTFWAFQDVKKNGKRSKYKDWFTIKRWDNPATPEDEFDYASWNGVRDLPEFRRDSTGLAPGPSNHIRAVVKRWMDPDGTGDPSDGIDGWRLDVADKVPLAFWRQFRSWVRGINPQAYLTGEVWWEDWNSEKMYNAAPWLRGDAFDAVMNYRWAREACRYFKDRKNRISTSEFDRRLALLRSDYRSDADYVLMNLLDSHDTDRLESMIVNSDTHYDHNVGVGDNRSYDVRKPDAAELETQKLMALFQMTYLGAPMIYYGDEAGMWGADDPDERKPMLWPDMKYDDEVSHPFGMPRPRDANLFNADLFNAYRKLIGIRRSHQSLSLGEFRTLVTEDSSMVYGYERATGSERAIVFLNSSPTAHELAFTLPADLRSLAWTDLLSGDRIPVVEGSIHLRLAPQWGALLVSEGS